MDTPRGSSIAFPLPIPEFHHGRQKRLSASSPRVDSESVRTQHSMAIPGARMDVVPPALPPPRYIHDLDDGVDLAWRYQNEDLPSGKGRLAPIKPGSSLLGHQAFQSPRNRDEVEDEDVDMDMDLELDIDHVPNNVRAVRSPTLSLNATGNSIPALTRRPPSSSGINQRLHGENPLAQQNHNLSTHAYDKHLLLKIGKGHSPPSHSKSRHSSTSAPRLSINTRGPNHLARSAYDSPASLEPVTKWLTSPTSAISHTSKLSWREYSMDPKTPSTESTSNSMDPDSYLSSNTRYTAGSRIGSTHSPEDVRTRSERGSYDSSAYTDAESVSGEHIAERPRPPLHHGIKRRALSPPHEFKLDPKKELPAPLLQVRTDRHTAPTHPSKTASLSSTASSTNYSSYTSSTLPSAASSMTSASVFDTPTSHSSRMFASPSSTSPAVTMLPLRKAAEPTNKMSVHSVMSDTRSPPSKIGNHFICSCCPKKPKKFDSEVQLRAHENEKQYTCAYCNNRFKNKNEAERHQNSLHLRKQSWSCATISTYQAAFHPSAFSNPRNQTTDTCGFCGDEFSNQPPNWDERIQHLTDIHKFGECNSKKKFYRADHFRQHLKHSHAGKSGKWTNILESNCQREEAASEAASMSPTASEHSQSGRQSQWINSTDASSSSGVRTIDESHEN